MCGVQVEGELIELKAELDAALVPPKPWCSLCRAVMVQVARNHALEESQRTQFLLDRCAPLPHTAHGSHSPPGSANVRNSELLTNLQTEGQQRLTEVSCGDCCEMVSWC